MSETLGVGIIGCGNISAAYLRLGPLFKGFEIRAVADLNMDAATARADEFSVRADSVEALLAADDIDIIINLTIPDAHYAVTRQILEAGKHAYSEKPLVLTMEEGQALIDLAASKGLRVGSAPDTFLGGAHQQARKILDDGTVGRIVGGTATVMSAGMESWHPNPDFFFKPGAGPVLDIGPYYVTNLIQLIGPVTKVTAMTTSASLTRTITSEPRAGETIDVETPTTIHAILEFASGALVTLNTSWDVKSHRHGPMELYGTDGTLYVPDPNFFGGTVETGTGDGITEADAWDHPFGRLNEGDRANYRTVGLADMAAGIASDRPHRCSLELAVHAVDVMTSILRAAEDGAVLTLSTTCDRPAALSPTEAEALLK